MREVLASLTVREVEVVVAVATGASNAEIARKLSISLGTVRAHLYSVFQKLGVECRVQLTVLALYYGLVDADLCRISIEVRSERVRQASRYVW